MKYDILVPILIPSKIYPSALPITDVGCVYRLEIRWDVILFVHSPDFFRHFFIIGQYRYS